MLSSPWNIETCDFTLVFPSVAMSTGLWKMLSSPRGLGLRRSDWDAGPFGPFKTSFFHSGVSVFDFAVDLLFGLCDSEACFTTDPAEDAADIVDARNDSSGLVEVGCSGEE